MRAVRQFAVAGLGDLADAVLVTDESGQETAGEHTAGVQRQYLGCAGRVANGINVVYASCAAPAGHAVISARLYVPAGWAGDTQRCRAADIPEGLEFKIKPQLANEILDEITAEGRCPPWVTGDEVYGRDARLRAAVGREAAPHGIRVNIVMPGLIDTSVGRLATLVKPDRADTLIPLSRQGTAWEVAHSVIFFLSDRSAYITGQTLAVDGGLSGLP